MGDRADLQRQQGRDLQPGHVHQPDRHQHADDQLCRWRLLVPARATTTSTSSTPRASGLSHDWTFNDANADLVGGKALGWTPSTFVATGATQVPNILTDATATTSACDPTAPGVLFVFGNDSRFTLNKGHVQLCA